MTTLYHDFSITCLLNLVTLFSLKMFYTLFAPFAHFYAGDRARGEIRMTSSSMQNFGTLKIFDQIFIHIKTSDYKLFTTYSQIWP